ncbi:MAG TPA: hypothetical protein VEK38_01485 [Candidatus Bathyarchaeia archaeon]|nr:hypothetical protein [Candidatus Bathyarchaeia archaeon]
MRIFIYTSLIFFLGTASAGNSIFKPESTSLIQITDVYGIPFITGIATGIIFRKTVAFLGSTSWCRAIPRWYSSQTALGCLKACSSCVPLVGLALFPAMAVLSIGLAHGYEKQANSKLKIGASGAAGTLAGLLFYQLLAK